MTGTLKPLCLSLLLCHGECDSSFPQGLGMTYQTAVKEFMISDTSLSLVCLISVTWKSVSVHHLLSSHSCVLEAFCSHTGLKMMAGLCLILYIKTAITNLSYNIMTYYTGSNLFNKSYFHAYCSHRNEK